MRKTRKAGVVRATSYDWGRSYTRDGRKVPAQPGGPDTFEMIDAGCGVVPVYACGCVGGHLSEEVFFTSARNDTGSYVALSGPYQSHAEALARLADDRAWACELDPRGVWYAYGTFGAQRENTIRTARELTK